MSSKQSPRAIQLVSAWEDVKRRITLAANGRKVRLVAVSKFKPKEDIEALYNAGQRHFGENYMQELHEKANALPKDINWHFIGGLQSNKCKTLASEIPGLYAVETVDSIKKANKLNAARADDANILNIFIQVNTSLESEKSGIPLGSKDLIDLAVYVINECPKLTLQGLMTIGSINNSKAVASGKPNQDFLSLVEEKSRLLSELKNLKVNNIPNDLELSMGMSSDFEDAIRDGSTNVRVGSTIFGARPIKS